MRAKYSVFGAVVAFALLFLSTPIFAHHGSAAYNLSKTITSKATVTSVTWANPHCILNFDIKDEKGDVTHWSVEMYNPLYMVRSGWAKDSLKAGDEITISFHPATNGKPEGIVRDGDGKIMFNGHELGLRQQ